MPNLNTSTFVPGKNNMIYFIALQSVAPKYCYFGNTFSSVISFPCYHATSANILEIVSPKLKLLKYFDFKMYFYVQQLCMHLFLLRQSLVILRFVFITKYTGKKEHLKNLAYGRH